jgi:hypothetical protein
VSMYRSQCLVVRSGKNRITGLNFPIISLWDVTLFQVVKGDFQQGNIAYIFRKKLWEDNDIFLQTCLNFA